MPIFGDGVGFTKIGELQHLWVIGHIFHKWARGSGTPTPRESDMLVYREILTWEHENAVVEERLADAVEFRVGQRPKLHFLDGGAAVSGKWCRTHSD